MNTALLIIDVQKGLVDAGIWNAEGVIGQLNQLIASARSKNVPVVFVRDTRVAFEGFLHPALQNQANDKEFIKSVGSSFAETELDEFLRSKGITHLVVGGMQSDYCVNDTTQAAIELGYDVSLVSDAHSTMFNGVDEAETIIAQKNEEFAAMQSSGSIQVIKTADVVFEALIATD